MVGDVWSQMFVVGMMNYALHSTLFLGGALFVSKLVAAKRPAQAENLLRVALLGGILTAGLQTGFHLESLSGSWHLFSQTAEPALDQSLVAPSEQATPLPLEIARNGMLDDSEAVSALVPMTPMLPTGSSGQAPIIADRAEIQPLFVLPDWKILLLAAWGLISLLLCLRLAGSWFFLYRHLASRQEVHDGPLLMTLGRLLSGRQPAPKIRLTVSDRLQSPIALGLFRPEICVPERVLDLKPVHQETLLAHETAHVLDRDPLWLLICRLVECIFFFQPLNRMVSARLQSMAEYRCDDLAAVHTGQPLELARCLTEVASWRLAPVSPLVPGMVGSQLSRRVHRLLESIEPGRHVLPRWFWPASMMALLLMVAALPGFSVARLEQVNEQPLTVLAPNLPAVEPVPAAAPEPESPASPDSSPQAPLPTNESTPVTAVSTVRPSPRALPDSRALAMPASIGSSSVPRAELPEPVLADDSDLVDKLEDEADELFGSYEKAFDYDVEEFEDYLEDQYFRIEDSYEDNVLLAWRLDAIEKKFEKLEDETEDITDTYEDRLEQMENRFDDEIEGLSIKRAEALLKKLEQDLNSWSMGYKKELGKLKRKVGNKYR